ncbi:ANL family adenylate-forming protein [Cohnella cholangitidis]|uniref:Long-chain-fatty-acid--CoA ligase n=1 Tax=Cohnella cholangitidis TaxID=2598458 RepID=A0A7G5BXH2_9BACL|nr:fatty acid--CoA ligase family protein [Cohnella cholangitidis]QMV41656.1 AMP-binding protein [Cohnella cholangitidis]
MEPIFLVHGERQYTYGKLIEDLNSKRRYSPYLYVEHNRPYEIFLSIIHSLVYDYSLELLDGDFSEQELENLGIEKHALSVTAEADMRICVKDTDDLFLRIKQNQKWTLTLYTSGTTGRPKKVSHSFHTLTRNIKVSDKFHGANWAFAYNPTHMAGLQVFFQALLNGNMMVYFFDEQPKNFPQLFEKYSITHISATATFYRNTVHYLNNLVFTGVRSIAFGGEKYDSALENVFKPIFPQAIIRNIYASTEAGSLFVARGDIFHIPESIQPYATIKENRLFIHRALLGASESLALDGEWFNTGDLVEQLDRFSFKFLSRQSDLINVGGYKVNPIEVENILMKVPGVVDALVKGKENSVTGMILVADIVKEHGIEEKELKKTIKQAASLQLQEWKVPRIITFVEEVLTTRTGKKARK